MQDLRQEEVENKANAVLFFNNNKQLKVYAQGKRGIFTGFLTIIDGFFSINELQEYSNESLFFITEKNNIQFEKLNYSNNHIVVMANNSIDENNPNLEKITFISNFNPKIVSNLLSNSNDYTQFNGIKCMLFFPDDISLLNNDEFKKHIQLLQKMPNEIYQMDFLKDFKSCLQLSLKNLYCEKLNNFKLFPISFKRIKVAVIDFCIPKTLLRILQKYFQVSIFPLNIKFKYIEYLYKEKKIDSVIIPDFVCNTDFIEEKIKAEIGKLFESKIPTLGIGNGAIFMAEYFGSKTQIVKKIFQINNSLVIDFNKKQFYVSDFCYKKITNLSSQLKMQYLDTNNNIVGFENLEKNNMGYTFSFSENNLDTAYFLNEFFKKNKNVF